MTGVPATLNVKFAPKVTPLPAILQICRKPVVGGGGIVSTKVAMVWPPGVDCDGGAARGQIAADQ